MEVRKVESLSPEQLERLAAIFCEAMPGALVARLGARYTAMAYRYFAGSSKEDVFLCTRRDKVVGGALVSYETHSLARRLLFHTPLLFYLPRLGRSLFKGLLAGNFSQTSVPSRLPELVHIFLAGQEQGKGLGTKILEKVEEEFKRRAIPAYTTKTEDSPGNLALGFYRNLGFREGGKVKENLTSFALFEKRLN